MEVILLEKVHNLGDLGEQVKVKPGFGRNFLMPQGKAVPATKDNVARFEKQRDELEARAREQLGDAQQRKAALEGAEVTITARASGEGKLYGSVGPREIADAFIEAGKEVEKSEIIMGEGVIREGGEYDIELQIHADMAVSARVIVVAEEE